MSTKNLARTVIEGGRSRGNTWERRHSNAVLRAAVRAYRATLRDREGRYHVDARGLLRALPQRRPTEARRWLTRDEQAEACAFAAERKIRRLGRTYFWLEMTFVYRWTKGRGPERQPTGRYRQTRRLTDAEVRRLLHMPAAARATLLLAPA